MLLLLFLLSHPTINFVAVAPPAFPYVFQSFPLSLDTLPYSMYARRRCQRSGQSARAFQCSYNSQHMDWCRLAEAKRHPSGTYRKPRQRKMLIALLRTAASMAARCRPCKRSSSKRTSRTRCTRFSITQWLRSSARSSRGVVVVGARRVAIVTHSSVHSAPRRTCRRRRTRPICWTSCQPHTALR